MSNKDIPDEATTKRVQELIADATHHPEPPESRDAWAAFEKLVEESEPEETPEEAAERWARKRHGEAPEDIGFANEVYYIDCTATVTDFLAGVRWAEERSKK